jgi:ribosomal protein S18 acetylase RimI-like enzyme
MTADAPGLITLFHRVYNGSYSDPQVRDYQRLRSVLTTPDVYWYVAEDDGEIVGSCLFHHERTHAIARVSRVAVDPICRGQQLARHLIEYGQADLAASGRGPEVTYAMTRTVHGAMQSVFDRLDFKKLGVFPNIHKTQDFETHCLVAHYTPQALVRRQSSYMTHPGVTGLVELACDEMGVPPPLGPPRGTAPCVQSPARLSCPPALEGIRAPAFVAHRYARQARQRVGTLGFFPFQKPNLLVQSPDQRIEVFLSCSEVDGNCALVAASLPPDVDYDHVLRRLSALARDEGVRYLEILVRADEPDIINHILRAKFIPSAFVPALQVVDGQRVDYVVFSRTYEILDFAEVELSGRSHDYLRQYFDCWQQYALNPLHQTGHRDVA